MLCPYHGDYNDRLDRCPACVESRQRTRAAATWVVPVEMDELASLRARIAAAVEECVEVEADAMTMRGERVLLAASRRIRAKLEGR